MKKWLLWLLLSLAVSFLNLNEDWLSSFSFGPADSSYHSPKLKRKVAWLRQQLRDVQGRYNMEVTVIVEYGSPSFKVLLPPGIASYCRAVPVTCRY